MPIVATRSNASARGYGWSATIPESLDGMVLITPTSIVSTGTGNSSSIGANGSVTFTSCETVSLNGVFISDYDNYMIVCRDLNTGANTFYMRMRASGTDNTTASSYTSQELSASGTSVGGARTTDNYALLAGSAVTIQNGWTTYCYGPYLTQPTAGRSVTINGTSSARIRDFAFTHNQSVAYDGFTLSLAAVGTSSGLISVYGLEN